MRINREDMRYCQFCGSECVERNHNESSTTCLHCGKITYLNSRPSVCAIITDNNRILLILDHNELELWDLPGGFLLYGESPEEGLRREIMEELNVNICVKRLVTALVDIYTQSGESPFFSLNLFYEANLLSSNITMGDEIRDFKWFHINELPSIKYPSTSEVLSILEKSTTEEELIG